MVAELPKSINDFCVGDIEEDEEAKEEEYDDEYEYDEVESMSNITWQRLTPLKSSVTSSDTVNHAKPVSG